jgi:benzylsuccinate CoA-transferase BbsF subunit
MRHPGAEPDGWGFSYSDMAAGCSAALAVLIALRHRRCNGVGQHVDLSQFENLVALSGPELLFTGGEGGEALDNRSQEMPSAPHGVYRCRDQFGGTAGRERWCAIVVRDDDEWARLCRAAGEPGWRQDPRFSSLAGRVANRVALDACIEAWTCRRSAEEITTVLQSAGVAAGIVADAADLCRDDAHLRERGYWKTIFTPEGDAVVYDGVPVRLSETPAQISRPGPLLGEHTQGILERVLGLAADEIAALRAANVIV